jgi:hypothetical protein
MEEVGRLQQQIHETIEKEKSKLSIELEKLSTKKRKWKELKHKFDISVLGERIKLDVGGTLFATNLTTLTSHKDSFFAGLFSGRWTLHKTSDDAIFIDRDPSVFRYILNYLRGQKIDFRDLSVEQLENLFEDAEYYQLPELRALTEEVLKSRTAPTADCFRHGTNYELSLGNRIAKKISSLYQWDTIVFGTHEVSLPQNQKDVDGNEEQIVGEDGLLSSVLDGIHRRKVQILSSHHSYIMIGVAPPSKFPTKYMYREYLKVGWYLLCSNTTLYEGGSIPMEKGTYPKHPQPETTEEDHNSTTEREQSVPKIGQGQTVEVVLDLHRRELSFVVDGENKGVAFNNIDVDLPLSLCIHLRDPNDAVKLWKK